MDDEEYNGTSYVIPNTRVQNGELVNLTAVHYREDCLRGVLIPKLMQQLFQFGGRDLSGEEVLRHAIGHSCDPLILTGLKFMNKKSYTPDYLRNEFLSNGRCGADLKITSFELQFAALRSTPQAQCNSNVLRDGIPIGTGILASIVIPISAVTVTLNQSAPRLCNEIADRSEP